MSAHRNKTVIENGSTQEEDLEDEYTQEEGSHQLNESTQGKLTVHYLERTDKWH